MGKSANTYKRKSHIVLGELYFWTATINKWQKLLAEDSYKNVIMNSLEYLSNKGKIDVFAFVVMPNHIHLIWRINEHNGKETAQGSFLKYTAHTFKKMLINAGDYSLANYAVDANNKKYEFWQRDSLAILLYNQGIAYQKLDYFHTNPVAEHWQLVNDYCEYKYSTAKLYELGLSEFSFVKDLRNEF